MLIRLRGLRKSYSLGREDIPVLKGVDLGVEKGSFVAIVGPSGSGKSTLLNILGCLDQVTSGEYFLNGLAVHDCGLDSLAHVRNRSIGFVFQNFNLLPRLTVEQNVELPLIYGSLPKRVRREKVAAMLARLGVWERRSHRPHEISGGQRQRVAIARAMVKDPDFILADEPTGNLDSVMTRQIVELFHDLHQCGSTIVLITHEHAIAREAGRICRMEEGLLHER